MRQHQHNIFTFHTNGVQYINHFIYRGQVSASILTSLPPSPFRCFSAWTSHPFCTELSSVYFSRFNFYKYYNKKFYFCQIFFYYARYFRFYLLYWLQMTKPHITTFVAPVVVYARNPSSMSVMSLGLMPRRTHYKLGIGSAGGNRTQHFHLERVRTWPISRQHHI